MARRSIGPTVLLLIAGFTTFGQTLAVEPAQTVSGNTAKPEGPSLDDLGFAKDQIKGDKAEQARLDKRTHMLQMHQRLGLITLAPLIATLVTSGMAVGEHHSATTGVTTLTPFGRNLHAGLGIATVGLYSATASFAIFAPKIQGTPTRGNIRLHKTLAWVHGTGMILTPILGAMAYQQKGLGQKVHGIASMHPVAAWTTTLAYGAAIAAVSFKF
ncbi:MAG: hypothetical protein ABI824_06605 [Acidobacteriota bacterium]